MRVVQELRDISADLSLTFEQRLTRLLTLGSRLLGLELGILSHVQSQRYIVIKAVCPDNKLEDGAQFVLGETYCADTMRAKNVVAYHDIATDPGERHPCYTRFELRSYIAIPVLVNHRPYGTLNFSSATARQTPFSELDIDYLTLLAEWVGTEISRQQVMTSLLTSQRQIREQNALYRQVNELTGVGTWQVEMATGEVNWSPSLKHMLGLSEDACIDIECMLSFIKSTETRQHYRRTFFEKTALGEDWTIELEVMTADGKTRWVETRSHPVMEQAGCVRVIGATQDVTERVKTNRKLQRESQMATEALAARSMFLANMSHELRTPIHGVQGMLEALATSPLTSKQAEYCHIARQSAESLLTLVNDILDFAKIDGGHMRFVDQPLNFNRLVKTQLAMFTQAVADKGLAFTLDIDHTHDITVNGDSARIAQIIINLVSNAIKFTREGSIHVATRCLSQPSGNYLIRLRVKDTGIGIAPWHQHAIFKPFEQADVQTASQFGGTGLGLSIVAQIARHYAGGVKVESMPGEGACFTVTLQLPAVSCAAQHNHCHHRRATDRSQWKGFRVLVVEDNDINQAVIREQLNTLGIEPDFAFDGEQGVARVAHALATNHQYDIVLMDCQMPVMNGFQATQKLRDLGEATATLPIIALTANAMDGERQKCLDAGMNDYLTKPLAVEGLAACFRLHLVFPPKSA